MRWAHIVHKKIKENLTKFKQFKKIRGKEVTTIVIIKDDECDIMMQMMIKKIQMIHYKMNV